MPSRTEIARALQGAWRFAYLDRRAIQFFDFSHPAVWRSFWAAALCYPGFLILLWLRLDAETVARAGLLGIFLIESIGYVIGWCAFPLLLLGYCRWIGQEERGFDFIIVYNWSQVLQTAFLLVIAFAIDRILPRSVAGDLDLIAYLALLAYEWFIALVVIGAGGWIAASVVLIDIAVGSTVVLVAGGLY